MCFWIDAGDETFEEESCRCNHDALSASNGLALDLRGATPEFSCGEKKKRRGAGEDREKEMHLREGGVWWMLKQDASSAH